MRKPVIPLLTIALLLGAQATVHAQVTGTVSDARTAAPLADVTITGADGTSAGRTGPDGRFSVACSAGSALDFSKRGYVVVARDIVTCPTRLQVVLVPIAQGLAPVSVVGATDEAIVERPQAVTVLSQRELHRGTGLFLQDAINLTPGIQMQRRSMSGGQTITIRGYRNDGDRGNFAGTGYKAYYNGIPITDAEGITILDDIDFATLDRVDVIRGPASSLYGGGIGGVVNFHTAKPTQLGTTIVQETTTGNDGLLRSDTRLERVSDNATTMLDYGHQGYDSYRIHSASKKDYGTFLGEFRPSDDRTISTFLSYAHSRDLRAGELDSAQFAQELNTGETRYIDNDARSEVESFRAGVSQSYRLTEHVRNVMTAHYSGNVLEDVYAAGLNSKSNQNFGARVEFHTDVALSGLPLSGVSGAEFQKSNVFAQGYGLTSSVLGAMRSDLETHTMQYSLFTQWDVPLPAQFELRAGASANFIEYAIVDRLASSANPTHLDGSGRKTFDPVITPLVALRRMIAPNVAAYASMSQGYSPPTAGDAVIPYTGEPNDGLAPERATQYEIGAKGSVLGNRLSFEVALFDLRVSDKLSSRAVYDTDGTTRLYSYSVNAGDQDDRGLELAASYVMIDQPTALVSLLRPFVSYTYSDFTYRDFQSDENNDANTVDYSGNDVVGVAPHVFNAGVDVALRSGAYMNATLHHADGMAISYDNAHRAPGFSLVNAKVGFVHALGRHIVADFFVGGSNLTGSHYYTQVFLNHKFDTPNPHMYLPGPYTAKYYGGAKLSYRP